MNKRIKTILCIVCLITALCILCSCSRFANESNFSGNIVIPDDGIVKKDVFLKLKNENTVATIEGKYKDIKYQWTVFGSDIDIPKDINMGISAVMGEGESLEVELLSSESFGFLPVLSVYVPGVWRSLTATVSSGEKLLCGASLTSGDPTIVNFSLTENIFEYKIVGDGNPYEASNKTPAPTNGGSNEQDKQNEPDEYLSGVSTPEPGNTHKLSDGNRKEKDKYQTDPVPEGKQEPVEPEDAVIDKSRKLHCTFSIECSTILNNLDKLAPEKVDVLPKDGVVLKAQTVTFYEGESVFDVLKRVCREKGIHLEASWTPMYNSAYIEGINNLYEFDCGELSGWMYRVNGWYPNYGCSRYALSDGDVVEFRYTCDLGRDIGGDLTLSD